MEFLLDEEAQEFFAAETFEYPLAAGVAASPEIPPLATLDVFRRSTSTRWAAGSKSTIALIRESGLAST